MPPAAAWERGMAAGRKLPKDLESTSASFYSGAEGPELGSVRGATRVQTTAAKTFRPRASWGRGWLGVTWMSTPAGRGSLRDPQPPKMTWA
jgi:hypothetical protein